MAGHLHHEPIKAVKAAPAAEERLDRPARPRRRSKAVTRRWTTPEAFKPLILTVLENAGGRSTPTTCSCELSPRRGPVPPGDSELTPEGELRWRYAARRARVALIAEGQMTKGTPGLWQLA